MPNVSLAAGFRAAAVISLSLLANAIANSPVSGQTYSGNSFDLNRVFGYSARGLLDLDESNSRLPDSWEHAKAGSATVSSDVLRHPLTSRARRRLEKALHLSDLGKHPAAIEALRETLVKEPSAAPYAQNLLGVEYAENGQFVEARSSFEEAVRLMPHESVNHSNLGFSLAVAGDYNSAEQEARTAIQLDPTNTRAKTLLELVLHRGRTKKR
jgi:tetratricopeptide (TPR) repeat protein